MGNMTHRDDANLPAPGTNWLLKKHSAGLGMSDLRGLS